MAERVVGEVEARARVQPDREHLAVVSDDGDWVFEPESTV